MGRSWRGLGEEGVRRGCGLDFMEPEAGSERECVSSELRTLH